MSLPPHRHPVVVTLCLDWLHDTLPGPRTFVGVNTAPGFARPRGARSARAWRQCEQCGGRGTTRRGECTNCKGLGGWHYDPMDDQRSKLATSADAHPELDRPVVRIVRLSSDSTREAIEDDIGRPLPVALRLLVDSLDELRRHNRAHRAILQRVHVIRLDSYGHLREPERLLYHAALDHLIEVMPRGFHAPRRIRIVAAERIRRENAESPLRGSQAEDGRVSVRAQSKP